MGWEDRSYYRDRSSSGAGGILRWLWSGTLPLFRFKGIDVQLHASFVIYAVTVLIFGLKRGSPWQVNVESMIILFGIVLLHEFGHCFTARWVGGEADHILMTPLGGLAFASPPRRPLPTFLTVAGGPAVNAVICLITGAILWTILRWAHTSLYQSLFDFNGWFSIYFHLRWIFAVSMALLLFNLLPIFPLDGGQMLQSILWPKFGWYKSMLFACNTGIVGAVVMAMVSIATGAIMMVILWMCLLMYCVQMRAQAKAEGPTEFEDYSANLSYASENAARRRKQGRLRRWKSDRIRRQARAEAQEQERIDTILAKVSSQGMNSLTWAERRALKRATERQRQRELQDSRKY